MKIPDELAIRRGVPLAPRTTLELGGAAEFFIEARDESTLASALAWSRTEGVPVTILGGGSNVIVPDEGVAGLVIVAAMRGIRRVEDGASVRVSVSAGEPWDDLVASLVSDGIAGVEALSGIPGSTGATPIQNVGAYGIEIGDVLESVRLVDRRDGAVRTFSRGDCELAYRDSRLKREPDRYVVVEVVFALRRGAPAKARYAELERALPEGPTLEAVRETVLRLRRAKSMVLDAADPNRRSAGSFFTNPIVPRATAEAVVRTALDRGIVQDAAAVPRWDADGDRVKLAAGWLIERSGVSKGERHGQVGISTAHALALVHHGGGSARELLALADDVKARVRGVFGVELEREPVVLGA